MKLILKITTVVALAWITVAAQAEMVSRNVPLTMDVTRVYFTGSGELHLTQGEDEFIKLTAPEEVLDKVEARIKGRSLYLGKKKNSRGFDVMNDPIRFDVQLKQIDAVRIWGSAKAWLGDLQSDHLKVVLAGNNKVVAKTIKAWEMDLRIAGNCEFKGEQIETGEMGMKVSGSGKIGITEIDTPRLDLRIAGSGDVDLDALSAAKLNTEITGSANLNLKGKVDQQELSVAGSGTYRAPDLISNFTYVEVMGSGDVDVNVQKKLTAELSRGANLVYHGSTGLDVDMSGEGKYRNAGINRTD